MKTYDEVFSKGRKVGITKSINEQIIYSIKQDGWDFSDEKIKTIADQASSRFSYVVVEAELNEDELTELEKTLIFRVECLIREQKYKKPTEAQEKYYLTLLEKFNERGSYIERQIDMSIEIDRLSKKRSNNELNFYIYDNSRLQALRMKHYEDIEIKNLLFPTYYDFFNEDERLSMEGKALIAFDQYIDLGLETLLIEYPRFLLWHKDSFIKQAQERIKDVNRHQIDRILNEMGHIFRNSYLCQKAGILQ